MSPLNPSEPLAVYDALLQPLLRAEGEAEVAACIDILLNVHAEPIIRRIIRGELHLSSARDAQQSQHAGDLLNDAMARLLKHLRRLKASPADFQLPNYCGYVTTTTHNVINWHLQKLYPRRANLKTNLRHLLERHPAFDLWQNEDDTLSRRLR